LTRKVTNELAKRIIQIDQKLNPQSKQRIFYDKHP